MTDMIKDDMGAEDWPKGLYMIFVLENDARMGRVINLTNTSALINPWDFMFGGVDEEKVHKIRLVDVKTFHAFDDIWDMDDYFNQQYWKKNTGEKNDAE